MRDSDWSITQEKRGGFQQFFMRLYKNENEKKRIYQLVLIITINSKINFCRKHNKCFLKTE